MTNRPCTRRRCAAGIVLPRRRSSGIADRRLRPNGTGRARGPASACMGDSPVASAATVRHVQRHGAWRASPAAPPWHTRAIQVRSQATQGREQDHQDEEPVTHGRHDTTAPDRKFHGCAPTPRGSTQDPVVAANDIIDRQFHDHSSDLSHRLPHRRPGPAGRPLHRCAPADRLHGRDHARRRGGRCRCARCCARHA